MKHCVCRVTGRREYRGHAPGTEFVTVWDVVIQRAIDRRDIAVIREIVPTITPESFTLRSWPPPGRVASDVAAHTEPPRGGSLIEGGGG